MLDTGYYKIKRTSGNFRSYHYLRIFIEGKTKYYQQDHSIPIPLTNQDSINAAMEGLEVIRKLSSQKPALFSSISIVVSFEDEDGDRYNWTAKNKYALRAIFDNFPRLKKAWFGR